jgi:hypothetical protein
LYDEVRSLKLHVERFSQVLRLERLRTCPL